MTKKYGVGVSSTGYAVVEADSAEEAKEKATELVSLDDLDPDLHADYAREVDDEVTHTDGQLDTEN
jgi:hypothetical protein